MDGVLSAHAVIIHFFFLFIFFLFVLICIFFFFCFFYFCTFSTLEEVLVKGHIDYVNFSFIKRDEKKKKNNMKRVWGVRKNVRGREWDVYIPVSIKIVFSLA